MLRQLSLVQQQLDEVNLPLNVRALELIHSKYYKLGCLYSYEVTVFSCFLFIHIKLYRLCEMSFKMVFPAEIRKPVKLDSVRFHCTFRSEILLGTL